MTALERVRAVIKDLTDSPKHSFTYGDVLRILVRHFPELKKKCPIQGRSFYLMRGVPSIITEHTITPPEPPVLITLTDEQINTIFDIDTELKMKHGLGKNAVIFPLKVLAEGLTPDGVRVLTSYEGKKIISYQDIDLYVSSKVSEPVGLTRED